MAENGFDSLSDARFSTVSRIGVSARTSGPVYTKVEPGRDHLGLVPDPPLLPPLPPDEG
jgi:hypothetical protein